MSYRVTIKGDGGMALSDAFASEASREYRFYRTEYGYSHRDAVIRVFKEYNIWLDPNIREVVLLEKRQKEEEKARILNEEMKKEEARKQALVEVKQQAAVLEQKQYVLIKAEQREVEFLTKRDLESLLENPPSYGVEKFLTPADVLKGLGNQMLWNKGEAMLAKIEIMNPKPKEKAWTLPQD